METLPMPVITEPIDNGRIFLYRVTQPWSVEEVLGAYDRIKAFFDQTTETVHVLADLSDVGLVHAGALRTRYIPFSNYPNIGIVATVTSNEVTRLLTQTVIRLSGSKRVKLFSSTDEALAYLRQALKEEASAS